LLVAKQSPLTELHQANGAMFVEEDGWLLPLRFGDFLLEYQAVRSHVGLLDLCHRSLLRFTGPDRVSYLQGMVSNDVKQLAAGEGVHAAILNIQGKILADVRVFCTDDSFLLDIWESLKEKTIAHLNHYLIADEVEIADLAGQYGIASVQGPEARQLLMELFAGDKIPARDLEHRVPHANGAEVRVVRSTHTGEEGYDLIVRINDLLPVVARIQEIGKKFSLRWVGAQAQETLRIEAGIPRYGIDMDEDNLLLETGLDQAVSFDKGCYLGQEVVERVRSRGHINKKLVGVLLEGDSPAKRGDTIHAAGKEIGKVTSSILSPARKRPLALGYVQRDHLRPRTPVSVHGGEKVIPGEISTLPFISAKASCRP
jgi:folate-binding protein YgfZ